MSPEQASAPSTVDGRSDIYSLAVVLYEMLTGEVPFAAATPDAMLAAKALAQLPPLPTTIPRAVDAAIRRALTPNPRNRFATVGEFCHSPRGRIQEYRVKRPTFCRAVEHRGAARHRDGQCVQHAQAAAGVEAPARALGRIVVVPFTNATGDKSLDVVGHMTGDFLTEGLFQARSSKSLHRSACGDSSRSRPGAQRDEPNRRGNGSRHRRAGNLLQGWRFAASVLRVSDQGGKRVVGEIADVHSGIDDPSRGLKELRSRLMGWMAYQYDQRYRKRRCDRPSTAHVRGLSSIR